MSDGHSFTLAKETAMLVLSRKVDEKILIGEDIVLTVVKIDTNRIRIGIDAPNNVHILRGELAIDSPTEASESIEFNLSDRQQPFAHPQPAHPQPERGKSNPDTDSDIPAVAARLFASDIADNRAHPTPPVASESSRRAPLSSFMAT